MSETQPTSPKTLLLSCCAPCSIGVMYQLREAGCQFDILFYNPNIAPEEEYIRRRDENARVCDELGIIFTELPYDNSAWQTACQGMENEPERGKRCEACFHLRLKRAAEYAKENGYALFSSVLGFSRHKDMDQVNRIAEIVSKEIGIPYDTTNWRSAGGEQRAARLAQLYHLYKQNYCGCIPSLQQTRAKDPFS